VGDPEKREAALASIREAVARAAQGS